MLRLANGYWVDCEDTQGYILYLEGKVLIPLALSELLKFLFNPVSFVFKVTVTVCSAINPKCNVAGFGL